MLPQLNNRAGETKVTGFDRDLTASDDTGFTLSISAAGR